MKAKAPRFWRWLLERALPADAREDVIGDLEEVYRRRLAERGGLHAYLWYGRAALLIALGFLRERARAGRSSGRRSWGTGAWLELKLGGRLLVKYPGLTVIGGLAIAVAIGIASAWFEFASDYVHPRLPLPDGDRIVGLQNWDAASSSVQARTLHDFETWRAELKTIVDVGAFTGMRRNLITADGRVEPLPLAEMSASGFRVAGVPPLLGRVLHEADERPGAPYVVVLGYGVWQSRFGGDPSVMGQSVRVGAQSATVVGVMPEGFAFPINHRLWVPLRADPLEWERLEGPSLRVFGRLAPGASLESAQRELTRLGARAAADHPETNEQLRPRVLPYVRSLVDDGGMGRVMNAVFVMLLLVACVNVATLVFARTALRESEIVVRSALGATRGRVILQLFLEALVLSAVGAAVGIAASALGLRYGMGLFWAVNGGIEARPFWWNDRLSAGTFAYAALLTAVGAIVAGGIPALRATGRQLQAKLRNVGGSGSELGVGGVWTGVIVTQVALTVLLMSLVGAELGDAASLLRGHSGRSSQATALTALVALDSEPRSEAEAEAQATRFARLRADLARRLTTEPEVMGVTWVSRLPGTLHPVVLAEGDDAGGLRHNVHVATVADDFFDALGAPLLAGRTFEAYDTLPGRNVVIVNETFAKEVFGGADPVGRRMRLVGEDGEPEAWHEIVGVSPDLGMEGAEPRSPAGFYRPLERDAGFVHLVIRAADPDAFAPRLRSIAADLDPTLRLHAIESLARVGTAERLSSQVLLGLLALVVGMAMLLSIAGLYALMSFAVSRRTREIGIRVALGASSPRILRAVFGRAMVQLGVGILGGGVVFLAVTGGAHAIPLVVTASLMLVVGLLSCIVPARRGLRIEPTEALREA